MYAGSVYLALRSWQNDEWWLLSMNVGVNATTVLGTSELQPRFTHRLQNSGAYNMTCSLKLPKVKREPITEHNLVISNHE